MQCGSVVVSVLCVVIAAAEANELALLLYTCFPMISKELISLICSDVARPLKEPIGFRGPKCPSMKTRHGGSGIASKTRQLSLSVHCFCISKDSRLIY